MVGGLLRRVGVVWVICVLFAVLADWLFFGWALGVNLAIFAGALVVILVARAPSLWSGRGGWLGRVWVGVTLVSVLAMVEHCSILAVVMAVVSVGTLVLILQRDLGREVSVWVGRWMYMVATLWFQWIVDMERGVKWRRRHPLALGSGAGAAAGTGGAVSGAGGTWRVLAGVAWWVLPLLAGGVFLLIFAAANPVIERGVRLVFEKIWTVFDWLPLFLRIDRMLLWTIVGVGVYGVLRYRKMKVVRRDVVAVPPVVAGAREHWLLSAGMIVRCLIVFNGVFALQSILDCVYLFGGAALPEGMTYKEYAHRGAYPLVATALLTAVFVVATFRTGGPAQRSAVARRLVYAWIVQNIFLMGSTIWRLYLYVSVSELTRLRVSTVIWLVLVGMGFVWVIVKIVRGLSNAWLWRVNVATTFVVLLGCAFVNFDGLIAEYNVTHCREMGGTAGWADLPYLEAMGVEALPALARLREVDVGHRREIDEMMRGMRGELTGELLNWRGWTWRRWRVARAVGSE